MYVCMLQIHSYTQTHKANTVHLGQKKKKGLCFKNLPQRGRRDVAQSNARLSVKFYIYTEHTDVLSTRLAAF